ncbi:esterase, partial [Streptomyces sp. DT225]
TDTRFRPAPADRERAVATEVCPWRGRTVVGEVHDENAVVLGGVAGHAGLFSTLADMERIALCLLGGGPPLLQPDTLTLMATPRTDHLNLRRALAWQGQDQA